MTPFDKLAPEWVRKLMAEFGLTAEQAAGIVGNLAYESNGFQTLQEISPNGGRGGFGAAQWTGPRRRAFEAWCKLHGLEPESDEANYGYLLAELHGDYRGTIDALKKTKTDADAVFSVGQTYERPGGTTATHLPGFDGRLRYARRALAGAATTDDHIGDANEMIREPAASPDPVPAAVRGLQTALAAVGLYKGKIDGAWGPLSRAAIEAYHPHR